MAARTSPQPAGTPTWLDFWCHDTDAAAGFWRDFLGYDIPPGSPEFGGYAVAHSNDKYVFGIGPALPDSDRDTAAMYFATDDVDATAARIRELGGQTLSEPMDIPEHGRMVIATDPSGLVFALWQAKGINGYGAVDEPGFPCWQDCISSDPQASAQFYADLFGFTLEPMGPDGPVLAKLGEDGHFTVGQATDTSGACWVTYLLVEDLEASTDKAASLGASVTMSPTDLPFGRFAHLRTPGGAPFGLFVSAEGAQS